jgi:ribosomal protein L16 Arg81 hydroxylase
MNLLELREVAIMAACVDECNRAIEFKSSVALSSLSDELVKKIKHEAGDLISTNLKAQMERREALEKPFQEQIMNDPSCEDSANTEFNKLLKSDDTLGSLEKEEAEIWSRKVEFKYPEIDVPYQDFNTSFPQGNRQGSFLGYNWTADGLRSFKSLTKMGIIKITD